MPKIWTHIDLLKAMALAQAAHEGQRDKQGLPYYMHPLVVAGSVNTIEEKIVAILHDVVEDTSVTLDTIRLEFGDMIADAVDAITHRPNEPNEEYYERVKNNPLALTVKFADITHNTSPKRMRGLDPETRERLKKKYENALRILTSP